MFKFLDKLKYRLSHIDASSWHWKVTSQVIGADKAKGKACTYYWVKLPISMIILALAVICVGIWIACRALAVAVAWIFGFRFTGKITDSDDAVMASYNYAEYKLRSNGKYARFAPWQYLLLPTVLYLGWLLSVARPDIGVALLKFVVFSGVGIAAFAIVVYFATAGWNSPLIQKLRRDVHDFWERVCPPLVVAEIPEENAAEE